MKNTFTIKELDEALNRVNQSAKELAETGEMDKKAYREVRLALSLVKSNLTGDWNPFAIN